MAFTRGINRFVAWFRSAVTDDLWFRIVRQSSSFLPMVGRSVAVSQSGPEMVSKPPAERRVYQIT